MKYTIIVRNERGVEWRFEVHATDAGTALSVAAARERAWREGKKPDDRS